jgi:hypothetical protein
MCILGSICGVEGENLLKYTWLVVGLDNIGGIKNVV